jgi:hypothetical protein
MSFPTQSNQERQERRNGFDFEIQDVRSPIKGGEGSVFRIALRRMDLMNKTDKALYC